LSLLNHCFKDIWSIRQWRHWTSIWESEKRPYIWELDSDLMIGCRSESYIYISHKTELIFYIFFFFTVGGR
jgi:hypothetical protein